MLEDSLYSGYVLVWRIGDGVDIELTIALQSYDYIYNIHVEHIYIYNSHMQ
jgi:hypothetical protein